MIHFVKLSLDDGRAIAFPVGSIERIGEIDPAVATRQSKTGCIVVYTAEHADDGTYKGEMSYVLGTVDSVLAKIQEAQS